MSELVVSLFKNKFDVWLFAVKHGSVIEHIELYKYVGHPVTDEKEATEAAAQWLEKHGISSVDLTRVTTGETLSVPQEERQAEQTQGESDMADTATAKPRKRVQKKAAPKAAPKKRTMSDEHKAALAEGRNHARIVNAYLTALELHKPKRGRQRTAETVQAQLDKIEAELSNGAGGVTQLSLVQQRRDLTVELAALIGSNGGPDISEAQAEFVKIGKAFSDQRGISYGAWREVGVPADVLKEAGITRKASE